jgi:hypothetical protein
LPSASPTTPQQKVLDALAKAPVADRMNAKLAAKQFGALVKQFEDESSRNSNSSSPQPRYRERSGSGGISVESNSMDGEPPPASPLPSRLKRMTSFARRTSSQEKNYTESVWLRDQNHPEGGGTGMGEKGDSESNLSPAAGSGSALGGATEKNSQKILSLPIPSPEESVEIEKKQSALTLWRMSSADGNSHSAAAAAAGQGVGGDDHVSLVPSDEREWWHEERERGETKEMSPESTGYGHHGGGDGDWSPYTKSRKRRGTITRRR